MSFLTDVLSYISLNYDWLSIFFVIIIFSILSIKYFRNKETENKEPVILLLFAVALGMISVIPSILLSWMMSLVLPMSLGPVVIAPIAEEIGKGLIVGFIAWSRLIDTPMDGLVYGAMVGTGFAAVENFLYASNALDSSGLIAGLTLVSFRSAFQIIGHPLYTGITGFGIGLYKKRLSKSKYNKIWLAMILHSLWNATSILLVDYWPLTFIFVVILSIIIMKYVTSRAQDLN